MLDMLFVALAYFVLIHGATEAINNQLYHTYLSEREFSDTHFNTSRFISQHKILEVPKWCITTSSCQRNQELAQGLHNYCFKNECDYTDYYCLQNSTTSVNFCAHFNECSLRIRHIAKRNDSFPGYIDIYEVACPDGHVQPNEKHGCFSLCVPDNSKLELESIYTHDSGVSIENNRTLLNTDRPGIVIEDKSEVPHQDNPDGADDNGQVIRRDDKPDGITDWEIWILIVVSIIALVVIVTGPLRLVCKYWRSINQNDQRPIGGTRINVSTRNEHNNIFNLDNMNGLTLNVENQKQNKPLLSKSSSSTMRDDANRQEVYDLTMEDLKAEDPVQVPTEGERGSGAFQSLHGSQTFVKQPQV